MRILVVYCHPEPNSFTHAALERVLAGLARHDHEVEVLDLYADDFDPIVDHAEWTTYIHDPPKLQDGPMTAHFERLRWAEGLVFVHPTWVFSLPARLKGWLDRVIAPGVAFSLPTDEQPIIRSLLRHIRMVAVVTSTGTPWFVMRAAGMPGKTLILRALRLGFAIRCSTIWLCLHGIDTCSADKRARHLERVERRFARIR